jgi:predicted pyridoxine 5'-phosphate oxidase superfamily flavin-nucleotide-binding protein
MALDQRIRERLDAGVVVVVGTADASGNPSCCHAIGALAASGDAGVTVYLALNAGAETVANLATTGRLAVALSNPLDHATVQLKGRARQVRVAGEDERERVDALVARVGDVLAELGMPPALTRNVAHWPAFAVELRVEAVFDQTPGPRAGEPFDLL